MAHERPPPVPDGGRVAVLAPSAPVPTARLDRVADRLRSVFGLEAVLYPTARRDPDDGPAPPAERAEELMRAFADPAVDAAAALLLEVLQEETAPTSPADAAPATG